jgi:hypothetical protein
MRLGGETASSSRQSAPVSAMTCARTSLAAFARKALAQAAFAVTDVLTYPEPLARTLLAGIEAPSAGEAVRI